MKLGDLQLGNMGELQGISQQQDDLIAAIEAQIARLRQLLLLREQFIALITEIMTFITKYTEIVRDIEKGGHTIEEKIKKYDDVSRICFTMISYITLLFYVDLSIPFVIINTKIIYIYIIKNIFN